MNDKYITLKSGAIIRIDRVDAIEPKRERIARDYQWTNEYNIVGYYVYCGGAKVSITIDDYKELKEHLK